MQNRTSSTGQSEDAYAWRDDIRQQLDAQGRRYLIKVPGRLFLEERIDTFPKDEFERIHARLRTALVIDKIENPDTHRKPDGPTIEFKSRYNLSRCMQWEAEEAELRKLTNPDGLRAKQYPEFE